MRFTPAWNYKRYCDGSRLGDEAVIAQAEVQIATLQEQLKSLQEALNKAGGRLGDGAKSIDPATLPGIVVDDTQAEKRGNWTLSQSVAGYVGENYLHSTELAASGRKKRRGNGPGITLGGVMGSG